MNDSLRDANIPVLTEIIESPAQTRFTEAAPAADATSLAQEVQPTTASAYAPAPTPAAQDWSPLEHDIRERVLRQVMASIDSVLETRIRDTLADVLQVAVGSLAADIRSGLQLSLEQEIARAVSEEIARSQKTEM